MKTPLFSAICLIFSSVFNFLQAHSLVEINNTDCEKKGGEKIHINNIEQNDWLKYPDYNSTYLTLEFAHVEIESTEELSILFTGHPNLFFTYARMYENVPIVGNFCGEISTNRSFHVAGYMPAVDDQHFPRKNIKQETPHSLATMSQLENKFLQWFVVAIQHEFDQ